MLLNKDAVIEVIRSEPELTDNIFETLGYWRGFRHTLWMIFHPHKAASLACRATKSCIIKRIEELEVLGVENAGN